MIHPNLQSSLAAEVKQHTAQSHKELEDLLIPCLQSMHDLDAYAHFLGSFYGFFKPVESEISSHLDEKLLPDFARRRKADLLLQDLSKLGQKDLPQVSKDLPDITNTWQAFGALYVLEGSTLGGKGITRLLLQHIPRLKKEQIRFFNGYGKDTGAMWTLFQRTLSALPAGTEEREQIRETA